jgi:hypothetical protein
MSHSHEISRHRIGINPIYQSDNGSPLQPFPTIPEFDVINCIIGSIDCRNSPKEQGGSQISLRLDAAFIQDAVNYILESRCLIGRELDSRHQITY